jgi:hypothetical protein
MKRVMIFIPLLLLTTSCTPVSKTTSLNKSPKVQSTPVTNTSVNQMKITHESVKYMKDDQNVKGYIEAEPCGNPHS